MVDDDRKVSCVEREDQRIKLKGQQRFCVGTKRREIKTLSQSSGESSKFGSPPGVCAKLSPGVQTCIRTNTKVPHLSRKCDARGGFANFGVTNSSDDEQHEEPSSDHGRTGSCGRNGRTGSRRKRRRPGRTRTISELAGFVPFPCPSAIVVWTSTLGDRSLPSSAVEGIEFDDVARFP